MIFSFHITVGAILVGLLVWAMFHKTFWIVLMHLAIALAIIHFTHVLALGPLYLLALATWKTSSWRPQ